MNDVLVIEESWFEGDALYYNPQFDQIMGPYAYIGDEAELYGPDLKLHRYYYIGDL